MNMLGGRGGGGDRSSGAPAPDRSRERSEEPAARAETRRRRRIFRRRHTFLAAPGDCPLRFFKADFASRIFAESRPSRPPVAAIPTPLYVMWLASVPGALSHHRADFSGFPRSHRGIRKGESGSMQLERNQPAGNGLREALAPWFDHSAAWLVLLCIGLTIFAALTGYTAGQYGNALATLFTAIAATLAAHVRQPGARPRCASCDPSAAGPGAGSAIALGCGARRNAHVFRRRARSTFPRLQMGAGLLQFAFFPFAAMAAMGLCSRRGARSFGPQFWLEATLVALCVGAVLWLALPHDLPHGRAACARFVDRRTRRRDRRARCAPPAASRGLAGLAGSRCLLARALGARRLAPAGGACRGGRRAVAVCAVRCTWSRSRRSRSPRISITCAASGARRRWTRPSAARRSRR